MCARPLKPESELLHPRRTRKSVTRSMLTEAPKPASLSIRRKWKHIVDLCTELVLSTPPKGDNNFAPRYVTIRWPPKYKPPAGFPIGRAAEGNAKTGNTKTYRAESVLLWLYDNGIADESPRMLYAKRARYLLITTRYINEVMSCGGMLKEELDSVEKMPQNGCVETINGEV